MSNQLTGLMGGPPPSLDQWHRTSMQIRLALHPDDPVLIQIHLSHGEDLAALGVVPPWNVHERSLNLLLDTAHDTLLPIAWRMSCLDACCRPLGQLGGLVHDGNTAARLQRLARRLLSFSNETTAHRHGHRHGH